MIVKAQNVWLNIPEYLPDSKQPKRPTPIPLMPEDIVEHKSLPGVPLVVVSKVQAGRFGQTCKVRMPDGAVVPVLGRNLIR